MLFQFFHNVIITHVHPSRKRITSLQRMNIHVRNVWTWLVSSTARSAAQNSCILIQERY